MRYLLGKASGDYKRLGRGNNESKIVPQFRASDTDYWGA